LNEAVTWQSNSTSDLTRSEAALISAHWGEITQYLVPPGVAWRWGECEIQHRVKCNWKDDGLIRRTPDGERWMTTEALWCHVIENAGDDERVGVEASGQQLLLEDTVVSSEETRDLRDTPAGRRSRARQATLTGKIVDRRVVRSQHELDWARVNALKGGHGDDDREDATRHPRQSRLQTFEDYDRSRWDVTTPRVRQSSVPAPSGCVY